MKLDMQTLDVKPFNQFFFIDCIYNALFATLIYKEKSILPVLLNTTINFEYTEDEKKFSTIYSHCLLLDKLLYKMGTPMNVRDNTTNLLRDIASGLANNNPTFVFVDCYNESIRKDTYGKIHNDHCLLICGMTHNMITAIEQSNMNSLNYHKIEFPISDFLSASEGYEQYYIQNNKGEKKRYFQLSSMPPECNLEKYLLLHYREAFLENYKKNIKALLIFKNILLSALINDLEEGKENYFIAINEIINAYKIQKYIVTEVFSTRIIAVDVLLTEWSYLRIALFRKMEGINNDKETLLCIFDKMDCAERDLYKYFSQWKV